MHTKKSVSLHPKTCTLLGLFGFDSGQKWYVSMRSLVG